MQRIATYTFFFLWLCCATAHALETCIVDIRGISPIYENNVRAALSLLHMDPTAQISEPHIQALAVKGVGEAKTALVPFGYLQPEITVTWQQSQEQWIVLYDVVPGQATVVKTLQVLLKGTVTNDPYLKDMSSFHYLHPGDVMNHVLYEQMKVDLLDEAVRQGYLDARWVQHEVQISPNLRDAHIYLHLDLGTPYTIESIDINKNYFNTHFLTGFLNVHVGDRYIIENILSTQSRLNSNGYFSSVDVTPIRTDHHTVQLKIGVTPKKRFGFKIGAGYGTDTGPRATLGVDARFLNPFGHFSTARWNASTRKRSLKAYYNMPGKQPADALYTLAIGHQFEHIDEQRARTDQLGISYLDRSGLWRRTIDVFYYTESYTEYAGDIAQRRRFLLPSVNYVRTKFDDPLNATEGFRIDVTMRGAAKLWLKHSANFLQMHTLMKYLYPLGVKTQIIARSELGVTFSRPSDLPLSLRFFAGGDQSVRGFAYQELGPREIDPYGQLSVIGGKHVFVGSLEAVHRIQGPFALSCFMDMGTAMNTLNTLESLPLSAGMGVHYKTPVGPLRIELAHPLISREFGSTWRIHINLGPELS